MTAVDIRTLPDQAVLDIILGSEEGDLLRMDQFRRLIAQEFMVDHYRPFVETPDLLIGEDRLIEEWERQRPSIAAVARELLHSSLQGFDLSDDSSAEMRDRVLLRMAAFRRLDSWLGGQDRLTTRPHSLGGDLYRLVVLPGFPRPIKIGICAASFYGNDQRQDQELRRLFMNDSAVREVEYALFPLSGRGGLSDPDHWSRVRGEWRECEPLRMLEATTRRGAFPQGLFFQKTPCDVVPRIDPLFIQQVGPAAFARNGICPWWPRKTDAFIAERRGNFAIVADDSMVRRWTETVYLTRRRLRKG